MYPPAKDRQTPDYPPGPTTRSAHPSSLTVKTMADLKTILTHARELIADPQHWLGGGPVIPLTLADRETSVPDVEDAACFCAGFAIERAARDLKYPHLLRAWKAYAEAATGSPGGLLAIGDWNDEPTTTHTQVLAAFDKAIADA